MGSQTWTGTLITSQVDGTALSASVTPTSIIPASAIFTMPQNYLDVIGKTLRVRAFGRISTLVTTPGTMTLDVRFGATVVANCGAMALNTTAKTNVSWELDLLLIVRAIGSSATLMFGGKFMSEAVIGSPAPSAGGSGVLLLPASAPAVGTSFDSTAAQAVNLFGTWSINNAANSIQTHLYSLEVLN